MAGRMRRGGAGVGEQLLRWDVCSFPRRVGRCRRCGLGSSLSCSTCHSHPMRGRLGVATDGDAAATALPRTAESARWRWSAFAARSASLAVLVATRITIARLRRWSSGGRSPVPAVRLTTTTIRVSVSDAPRCALPSGPWSAMPVAEPARSRVIVPDGGSGCFLLSRTPTLHRSPLRARTQGWCSPRPGFSLACQLLQS